jgi:hypothetical protein
VAEEEAEDEKGSRSCGNVMGMKDGLQAQDLQTHDHHFVGAAGRNWESSGQTQGFAAVVVASWAWRESPIPDLSAH